MKNKPITLSELRWRCRRGMLELDLLLLPFLENHYQALDEQEKQTFIEILEYEDQTLHRLLMDQIPPETKEIKNIVEKIQSATKTFS